MLQGDEAGAAALQFDAAVDQGGRRVIGGRQRGEVFERAAHKGVGLSLAVGHQSHVSSRDHLDVDREIEGGDLYPQKCAADGIELLMRVGRQRNGLIQGLFCARQCRTEQCRVMLCHGLKP